MRACERTGSGSFERLDGTATITSVGFSNVSHGQTGRPNAFAVHPLLRPPGALLLACVIRAAPLMKAPGRGYA